MRYLNLKFNQEEEQAVMNGIRASRSTLYTFRSAGYNALTLIEAKTVTTMIYVMCA